MGAKSGLDPSVMIDVLNAGSGATSASRDKFPRAILPRTFDYGFATRLMVKDVQLYLDEARALGVPVEIAEAFARLWEATLDDEGADSDFTSAIKPIERRPASLSATAKSENDIIAGEEQHYSRRVRLWPLSGAINNRNAYGKPVD
jgi:hypothetical protein